MADYIELHGIFKERALEKKLLVACMKAAQLILTNNDTPEKLAEPTSPWADSNHANRAKWAASVIRNPLVIAQRMQPYVIVANSGQTLSAITGASDTLIQDNINEAIDELAIAQFG